MRLDEILVESMDFFIPDDKPDYIKKDCEVCDGRGFSYFVDEDEGVHYPADIKELRAELEDEKRREENTRNLAPMFGFDMPEKKIKFKDIEEKMKWVVTLDRDSCWRCDGTGTVEERDYDYEQINLSNMNAHAVMRALGYESDESYFEIKHTDIPKIKRKIMMLTNEDDGLAPFERETTDTQADRGMAVTQRDDGVTSISRRKGPRMISMGVNADYFKRVFKRLMPMLDYAQKNKMDISVG